MQTVSKYKHQPDEVLAGEASGGDQDAFAALYDRYFQGVYDFAFRMVRDPDAAADIVQNTFTKSWETLRKGRVANNVKAWLYTVARNTAIDELRHRKRQVTADEAQEFEQARPSLFNQVDASRLSDPQAALQDQELVELVWSSAASLSPKEYSLLDLHLRKGFSADELAANLGLRKGNVYTLLSRLRDSLEESVTASLLMRRGRRDCPQLEALLSERHATKLTHEVRIAIHRHLQECPRCQESKRRYVSPVEIFAGLAAVPAAPGLQGSIWQRVSSRIDSGTVGESTMVQAIQQLLRWWARATMASKAIVLGIVAAGIAAVIAVALVLTLGGDGGGIQDPSDVRSTTHEIGQPSDENVIRIVWSRQRNVQAYSILWSRVPGDLPDTDPDLPGSATGTRSPTLSSGRWYFHLRTEGENGKWTSTVFLGPFLIQLPALDVGTGPTPSPTPTPTPAPTPTATPQPQPELAPTSPPASGPTPTSTPAPQPTPTSTSVPQPTPTSAPAPKPTPTPAATPTPVPTPTPEPSPTPTQPPEPYSSAR